MDRLSGALASPAARTRTAPPIPDAAEGHCPRVAGGGGAATLGGRVEGPGSPEADGYLKPGTQNRLSILGEGPGGRRGKEREG